VLPSIGQPRKRLSFVFGVGCEDVALRYIETYVLLATLTVVKNLNLK